jgi:hypothetical protein
MKYLIFVIVKMMCIFFENLGIYRLKEASYFPGSLQVTVIPLVFFVQLIFFEL